MRAQPPDDADWEGGKGGKNGRWWAGAWGSRGAERRVRTSHLRASRSSSGRLCRHAFSLGVKKFTTVTCTRARTRQPAHPSLSAADQPPVAPAQSL